MSPCQDVDLTTDEDVPGSTEPNCEDLDGDSLTIQVVTQPSSGVASVGSLLYDPEPDFNGSDAFTYLACDPLDAWQHPCHR